MLVYLRSRPIAVPEQRLHYAQLCTVAEQVRSKGVPQRVWRELLRNAGLARIALDQVPEGLARHAIPAARREKIVSLALKQDVATCAAAELLERPNRFLAERNQPLPVALAADQPWLRLI